MYKLLKIADVAEILGISKTTAKIWASKRVFPIVKIGRLVRISPQALELWLLQNSVESRGKPTREKAKRFNHKRISFDEYVANLKREK